MKLKVTKKIVTQIDWKLIGYHKMTNELFKNSLSMSIDVRNTYSGFNKYILHTGAATATTNNKKNKGWFHFIHDFLLPMIDTRDALLSGYRTLGIGKV